MNFHLKDMLSSIVEDDGPPASKPAPVATPNPAAPHPGSPAVLAESAPADPGSDAYQRLAAQTDFTATPVFQTIQKYLAPMASMQLDEKTKFKVAVQQAVAQDHLSPDAISAAFDQFKADLQAASEQFQQKVAKATAVQVDAQKAQAESLAAQSLQLQEQVAQITKDALDAQQRLQMATLRFEQARQTRTSELAQEQARYASLLN